MQDKIKVLLIVYYWPPSGGAGVQRWVKLIRYFKTQNLIPYVLTVDEKYASYLQKDYSLLKDIPDDIKIRNENNIKIETFYWSKGKADEIWIQFNDDKATIFSFL